MDPSLFPPDVPPPVPYAVGGINYAAMLGAQLGRLRALGFDPNKQGVQRGVQFHVAFMRAMNELERLRAVQP